MDPVAPRPLPCARLSVHELDADALRARFLDPGVPVVLEDFAAGWPALDWTFAGLRARFGALELTVMVDDREETRTFGELLATVEASGGEATPALRTQATTLGWSDLFAQAPELRRDFRHESPLLGSLAGRWWPFVPPTRPQLYISTAGAVTPLHYDPDSCHTAHTLLRGAKRFTMLPYRAGAHGLSRRMRGIGPFYPGPPDRERFPSGVPVYRVELRPGETLVMPGRTWHRVEALAPSLSVGQRSHGGEARIVLRHFTAMLLHPGLLRQRLATARHRLRQVLGWA